MEKNWNQYWSNIMMKLCKNDDAKLYSLGQNKNLTLKTIEQHINQPWNWTTVSKNHCVTPEFIEKYIDKNWNWWTISLNPNITLEFIEKYIDKNWNWNLLTIHPNITLEFIEKYIDKDWSWKKLSENPKITLEFIEKYNNLPWDIGAIFTRNFNKEKDFFQLRVKHQQFVQDNLLEEFVKAYMHPNRIKKLLDMGYSINDLDNIL